MNKSEIIARVASETGMSQGVLDIALNKVLKCISSSLAAGDDVSLAGFGNFSVKSRKERQGRNPRTGEAITIAASKSVRFKPAKVLKEAVNQ